MKHTDGFYEVLDTAIDTARFSTTIQFNPRHRIYASHFPGYPVTPGVMFVQIIHELLERYFGRTLRLTTVSQCKFLKILNPNDTAYLLVHIEFSESEGMLNIKAKGEYASDIYFRLQSVYQFFEVE
jgi:3-hydroxyacyl-[acyl-carrier-protein] dehydratase